MSSLFHTALRYYYIYVIIALDTNVFFVGKSYSKNPRRQFLNHLKGNNMWTKYDFGPNALPENKCTPEFHILEALECTGAEAYKHVVAWSYYFENHHLLSLAPTHVDRATEHLHPVTREIHEKICNPFSLEEVLSRTIPIRKLPNTNTRPLEQYTPELAKLNIRLPEDILKAFHDFCSERTITQREGIRLLLLSQEDKCRHVALDSVLRDIRKRDSEIQALKEQIKELREQRILEQQKIPRSTELSHVFNQMLDQIIYHAHDKPLESICNESTMRRHRFKNFRSYQEFHEYQYPEGSGCCVLRLHRLIWGKGRRPPLFVLGITPEGTKLKFRWYPKRDFIGYSPRSSMYVCTGKKWLVGYLSAKDGATDAVAMLPTDRIHLKFDSYEESREKYMRELNEELTARHEYDPEYPEFTFDELFPLEERENPPPITDPLLIQELESFMAQYDSDGELLIEFTQKPYDKESSNTSSGDSFPNPKSLDDKISDASMRSNQKNISLK